MVSTRGMKFKFSEGEKVLCYEPDPTKAKVLYDSKVLELNVSRDARGRKVAEYLIHFYGWGSSWDRCVKEEFILPNTEENRNLKIKLATEAATFIKGKKKPPLIKDLLAKKAKANEREAHASSPKTKPKSPSISETSEDEGEKVVEILIPVSLRKILKQDWNYITKKNKVIKLPCEQNVICILEGYVKYAATKLLNASPPKSSKAGKKVIPENVESKIRFNMEVMDGIRIYFDFTLSHLLLYHQEKKRHYTIENTCSVGKVKSEFPRTIKKENLDTPLSLSPTVVLRKEATKLMPSPQLRAGQHLLTTSPNHQTVKEESTSPTSPKLRASNRTIQQSREAIKCKKPRLMGSRQGLRSADKSKTIDETCDCDLPHTSDQEMDDSPPCPQPESPPNSPSRQTRRSVSHSVTPQPALSPTGSTNARSSTNPSTIINPSVIPFSNLPVVTMKPLASISISNISSSASSTHSSVSCLKPEKLPAHLSKHFSLLKTVLEWKMIPEHIYAQSPPPPSLVYGAHHLLRLFVKLPELLYKTNMSRRKLQLLLESLNGLVKYLELKKDELFLPSLYIDSCSNSPNTHPVMIT